MLGAGKGEATCGILYLAGFLRRNGVEAFVRLCDFDRTDDELARTVKQLLARVKPTVVGISLKWYLHVHRAVVMARAIRRVDPSIRIVLGGNTAALWWKELLAHECFDDVVLGDGEVPFLALCQGAPDVPNRAHRGHDGLPVRAPFGYVQGEANAEVHYSHFDELFLSELDVSGFSGWVAPGKGCDQSCVYCGGRRAAQRLSFGRMVPSLRPIEAVQRDHREIHSRIWQYRYDFPGGSTEYLCDVWPGLDLRGKCTTYFLWGVPARRLVKDLSATFDRVALILDIGCFSQTQRLALMKAGLLKPCPTDEALFAAIDDCLSYPNLELEVCGIAGLPMTSVEALEEERSLVERLLARGCRVGYQRLQSQPGALVTSHAERFGMHSEAVSFDDFFGFFSKRRPGGTIPMVRFLDAQVERRVSKACERLDAVLEAHAESRRVRLHDGLELEATTHRRETELTRWLGAHRVPGTVASTPVTVLRSATGAGKALAPTLEPRRFDDPSVQHSEEARAILSAVDAFVRPAKLGPVAGKLARQLRVDRPAIDELIDHLVEQRFLSPRRG